MDKSESQPQSPVPTRPQKRQKNCVPSFISKTFQILEKQEHGDIVCWSENGLSFYVKNIKEFEEKILPIYFRHKNFASFVRQLNMYDFHKIRGEQKHIFEHKLFQRHNRPLLMEIRRKCFKKSREDGEDEDDVQDEIEDMPKTTPVKASKKVAFKSEPKEKESSMKKTAVTDKDSDEDILVPLEVGAEAEPDSMADSESNGEMEAAMKEQAVRRAREAIEHEKVKKRERNLELMNEIIAKLKTHCPKSDREIKDRINLMRNNPRYDSIKDKSYVFEIYKKLKEGLFEVQPRRSIDELDELSIEEDILYNQIERPSKFKIVSLTNFETENFMFRSSREVIRGIVGDGSKECI